MVHRLTVPVPGAGGFRHRHGPAARTRAADSASPVRARGGSGGEKAMSGEFVGRSEEVLGYVMGLGVLVGVLA
ncbi:hypothetical protein, partial [Nocardiopsis potens]|uniref:hypothetical protein n=1 Tax=Nocardiopsis potens TaxID=1246458 RepID=UPI0019D3C8BF